MEDGWNQEFETPHVVSFTVVLIAMTIIFFCIFGMIIISICFRCCTGKTLQNNWRKRGFSRGIHLRAPAVVTTTTTIPVPTGGVTIGAVPSGPATYTTPGFQYPPTQPGYPHAQSGMYPNQSIPQPYPMPQPQVDHNPPPYDQVVRGGEAYQKQAPYNPNYTG